MRRYLLEVEPEGSLFIGGYSHNEGVSNGDTASDHLGLLLPGSVIKGAIKESAERLVEATEKPEEGRELISKLFGFEAGDRPGGIEKEGILRVGPLRPKDGKVKTAASLRHHVSLERARRQSSDGRLFQNRVTPSGLGLCFEGEIQATEPLSSDQEDLLTAAISITDQIGGGRGRGLGLVRVSLGPCEEASAPKPQRVEFTDDEQQTVILELEAYEPLRLGVVKDGTNVLTSKTFIDGSVVRGAIAAVLVRQDKALAELVLGGDHPTVFGDAHAADPSAFTAPFTLLARKRSSGELKDVAAFLCAERMRELQGQENQTWRSDRDFNYKEAKGTYACFGGAWQPVKPKRRTVTRSARNRLNGRSDDGRLFSLELLDPMQDLFKKGHKPLRFYAPITGTAKQLREVIDAAGQGLLVGGVRTRGFGGVRLKSVLTEQPWPSLEERHRAWVRRIEELSELKAESTAAIVALGPVSLDGPSLAETLKDFGFEVIEARTRRYSHGGWNRAESLPRLLSSCFSPGSTWILRQKDSKSALPDLAELEKQGLGPGRADGWGRVLACHPIHLADFSKPKEVGS